MDTFLQDYRHYRTEDGRVAQVYVKERIGGQFGSHTGRVGGIPGLQMWSTLGGGHIGNVSDWYLADSSYHKPIAELALVERATEEEITQYQAWTTSSLDTQAAEAFVSYPRFSRWVAQHASQPLVDRDNPGVNIVREYLASWQGSDVFALMWNSWFNGYNRYGAVVGLEFIGLRYVRLPNWFRVLQQKNSYNEKTYADLFAGITDNATPRPIMWKKDREDLDV